MGNAQDKPGEKVDTLDHMAITGKGKISDAEKKKIKELYGRLFHTSCPFFLPAQKSAPFFFQQHTLACSRVWALWRTAMAVSSQ